MRIRKAKNFDKNSIQNIYNTAFSEMEREVVSELAIALLSEQTIPQTLSLVAEIDSELVAHVAFSPVMIENNEKCQGYILAPLAVQPTYQKKEIGSKLVASGIQQLSQMDIDILFVYGDPKYYGRFGFTTDIAKAYMPPYPLQYPFGWQGVIFNDYRIEKHPVTINCIATPLCNPALW